MDKNLNLLENWSLLQQFLPRRWEDMARKLGAIVRQRKFTAADLLRLLLIHLADGCSLRETVARAKQGGLVTVSDVALLKRLRASSEWLRWMAVELLSAPNERFALPDCVAQYHLKSVDATIVSEPGSTGTDWRVHYCLDLLTLQCEQFILSRQELGESLANFKVNQDDLFIADRAYGRLKGMMHIRKSQGQFLVRIKNKAFTLFDRQHQKVDMLAEASSLQIGEIRDLRVCAEDARSHGVLEMRLIMIRKSDEAAEAAIRRIQREEIAHQKSVDATTLALHRYVILVTSLPEAITGRQAAELYRLRWQIELAFKRLKSILGLGHLPKTDLESCRAWLHGKLFIAQLARNVMESGRALSPWGYPIWS
jgi:hypothetical protein